MSDNLEQKCLQYINSFRSKPSSILSNCESKLIILKRFTKNEEHISQVANIMEILKKTKTLPKIRLSQKLCKIAEKELDDLLTNKDSEFNHYKTGNTLKEVIPFKNLKVYIINNKLELLYNNRRAPR